MTDLDPDDWQNLRQLGHRMMDDMFDHLASLREQPVWRKLPDDVRASFNTSLPRQPTDANAAYDDLLQRVVPYATGNTHPRFMGWVHGGGTPVGMLAELLAGALNANLGGRDHAPIEIEREVIRWSAEMLGFPRESGGVLVTGTSVANLIAVLVARTVALGADVRKSGIDGAPLTAYAAVSSHGCVSRAMDMAGLGTKALRIIPCDSDHRIDLKALADTIARDRAAGARPFMVVGTAGTVDVGAFDDLAAMARLCAKEKIWFHVDAAFGALALLSPELRPLLAGIERADSVAFDFHKTGQVPYDAGCIMVRDRATELAAFSMTAPYLARETRGLAAGAPWPCDLGPDLSRGFRALKVWLTLKVYGADKIGATIAKNCALARHLAARIDAQPELERLAPVPLNIVCFRYKAGSNIDQINADIVADIQESGIAAPSTTTLDGRIAIRAALINHRTREEDVDALVDAVLTFGRRRTGKA